jgi:serine/threonine protein kinase
MLLIIGRGNPGESEQFNGPRNAASKTRTYVPHRLYNAVIATLRCNGAAQSYHSVSTGRMPSQANQPLPEGYPLENYRIASVLSSGGFSIVYLAYDESGLPVAIKEYLPSHLALREEGDALPSIAEDNVASFRYGMRCFFEEGRSLARLSHPNVVRVLNFFRANETVYMVMRYERGRTLQEHIQARHGTLKESFIRNVFANLLNGLREVHSHKLLHLDIKPANIYIRNDGTPVLIDFGAARQTLSDERPALNPMYTPGFAPPEQYRDRDALGPWSDIYSIGATLFSCFAGAAPQAADLRLDKDRYVSAARIWEGKYSRELLQTTDWCLELDHMKRPQSVFALQKVLLGEKAPEVHARATIMGSLRENVLSAIDRVAGRGNGRLGP